jgi:hypothetical protein
MKNRSKLLGMLAIAAVGIVFATSFYKNKTGEGQDSVYNTWKAALTTAKTEIDNLKLNASSLEAEKKLITQQYIQLRKKNEELDTTRRSYEDKLAKISQEEELKRKNEAERSEIYQLASRIQMPSFPICFADLSQRTMNVTTLDYAGDGLIDTKGELYRIIDVISCNFNPKEVDNNAFNNLASSVGISDQRKTEMKRELGEDKLNRFSQFVVASHNSLGIFKFTDQAGRLKFAGGLEYLARIKR